ncbi:MAG TPA: hypothetical protein VIJ34_15370, partial [Acidimicrobiales bacterium]
SKGASLADQPDRARKPPENRRTTALSFSQVRPKIANPAVGFLLTHLVGLLRRATNRFENLSVLRVARRDVSLDDSATRVSSRIEAREERHPVGSPHS